MLQWFVSFFLFFVTFLFIYETKKPLEKINLFLKYLTIDVNEQYFYWYFILISFNKTNFFTWHRRLVTVVHYA